MRTFYILTSLVGLTLACASDDGGGNADGGPDSAAGDTDQQTDTVPDGAAEPSCGELADTGESFDIAIEAGSTAIHPDVAFDGSALWITFALPDDHTQFDVWATRVGCDGTELVPPLRLNTAQDANEGDPAIAVSGDRVLVAWLSDTGQAPNNLELWARLLATDGTPVWAEDRRLRPHFDGQPNALNTWMPELEGEPGGGFILTGAWGVPPVPAFQAFWQRLDEDGELVGEAVEASRDADHGQTEPDVAVAGSGQDVLVGWYRSGVDDADAVEYRRFDGTSPQGAPAVVSGVEGSRVSVAFGADGTPLVAASNDSNPASDITVVNGSGSVLTTMDSGGLDHTPTIATDGTGAAVVVFFRVVRGFANELYAQAVDADEPTRLDDTGLVAPYETTLVSVGGGLFFTVWSEGENPEFTLRGRFVGSSVGSSE